MNYDVILKAWKTTVYMLMLIAFRQPQVYTLKLYFFNIYASFPNIQSFTAKLEILIIV